MTDKKLIILLSAVIIITVCIGFFITNNDIYIRDWSLHDDVSVDDESSQEPYAPDYKVNINTAGKYELTTLPYINDTIADAIIKRRETRGDFKRIEQLAELEEISEYIYFQIKDYVVTSSDFER